MKIKVLTTGIKYSHVLHNAFWSTTNHIYDGGPI